MTEQTLYTNLLKGSIIGRISYANYLATGYAEKIANEEISLQNRLSIFADIKRFYGDMMEENEEEDLVKLLESNDNTKTIESLKQLDKDYVGYFLEILSTQRKEVETIYNEISDRTKIVIEDDEIKSIKKAESNENLSMAGNIWREIIVNDINAIYCLHKNTYPKIQHILRTKIQQNIDTDIEYLVDKAMVEFKKKLTYQPKTTGYFEYRPCKEAELAKSSVCNYFITLCVQRGKDFLKKIFKHNDAIVQEWYGEYDKQNHIFEDIEDYESQIAKVKYALNSLKRACQEIILGKYFGGLEGKVLSSIELANITHYSVGHINNNHRDCIEQLKELLSNKNQFKK
jgi:hypothetical protein